MMESNNGLHMQVCCGHTKATRATAGEGGAWGIALLAAYRAHVRDGGSLSLVDFLHG